MVIGKRGSCAIIKTVARQTTTVEVVVCDICGKQSDEAVTVTMGWESRAWELDVCPADNRKLSAQFDRWIGTAGGGGARLARRRTPSGRRSRTESTGEWEYLESLGFKKHRGRRSAAEDAALARRHESGKAHGGGRRRVKA